GRIGHLAIELAPVLAGKLFAQFADRLADVLELVGFDVRFNMCHQRKFGRSTERIVAVPNAQMRSASFFLEITSIFATLIVPPACKASARAMISSPSAGLRKLILISTVTPILPSGSALVTAAPAA